MQQPPKADDDDPEPEVTWLEVFWYAFNRTCEETARYFRAIGLIIVIIACFIAWAGYQAHSRWDEKYASNPPEVQAWYRKQHLTPEAEARLGFRSCCSEGDEFPTQFRIVQDGTKYGSERYLYLKDGHWLPVPQDIVKHEKTPDGAPHLWLYPYDTNERVSKDTPVCFIIDGAGI